MQKASLLTRYWRPAATSVRHYLYPRSFIQHLKNDTQPERTQLDNGLTVVTLQRDCCNACIGIYADAGSRYENNFENGIAHLYEHLVFKSTPAMPREKLQEKINGLGIRLHAHTTRELVTHYAECLSGDVEEAFNILSSCVLNTVFNCDEIRTEKYVVFEEILKQENDPQAIVFDYLHSTAFQGTGLANSIVGPSKNLYSVQPSNITQYIGRVMHPCRMCLCAVGAVTHEHIVCLANRCMSRSTPLPCMETLYRYTGSEVRYRNDYMPKAHVAFAMEGPPFSSIDSIFIDLACAIIGGWDKSQYGGEDHAVAVARRASGGEFCDAYKSFHLKYKDTSLFGAQFVASSLQHEDMLFTLQDILIGMCSMVTEGEFERAKEQLKTKILYETSTCYGAAKDIATHMLYNCCHWPTLYDRVDFIDRMKIDDFKKTMFEYLFNKCPVVAAVGPTEGLPDYNRIRASMYWISLVMSFPKAGMHLACEWIERWT